MTKSDDAVVAARLCTLDPRLGGLVVRGDPAGVLAVLRDALPGAPFRRLPVHADADALTGGLDLGATLASGRPVTQPGLLAAVDGGVLVIPLAERLGDAAAGCIARALDEGQRFVVVALDEGREGEMVPAALAERLAFRVEVGATIAAPGMEQASPHIQHQDVADNEAMAALAATAAALGIASARAPMLALRAARAAARLAKRTPCTVTELTLAVRLVLAPRATQQPADTSPEPTAPSPNPDDVSSATEPKSLDDIVLAAARTAIPADVLARIAAGRGRGRTGGGRGAGERRRSPTRGRPVGTRAGLPREGLRLSLIDTLRAAAPWQRLRGRDDARIRIRRDDLRIRRFEARAQATTIFAVDASGSAALARLAEAKGAVELLLGQAYVKRAQVALVAFRGTTAENLLPPTRSLARARRLLGDLPGGGGTPLAAGLDAARELALAARARGQTPFVVVLTDGRANVARDGGRDHATADAEAAARALAAAGIASAFVDISPRPRPEGQRIAAALGARYLALPRADAHAMHVAIAAAQ